MNNGESYGESRYYNYYYQAVILFRLLYLRHLLARAITVINAGKKLRKLRPRSSILYSIPYSVYTIILYFMLHSILHFIL